MKKTRTALITLAAMMTLTFSARLLMLSKSDFAPGLDGYSYAVQTYSLKHFNRIKDPDTSPVLYFLGGLAKIIGDPVTSNKIGAALLAALLLLPAFLLGRELSGRPGPGLLLAALLAISPSIGYMSIEFLKNLGALSGLLFFLYALLRSGRLGFTTKRTLSMFLLFLFCLFAHRTTAVLAAACGGLFFLPLIWKNKKLFAALFLILSGGTLFLVLAGGGLHFLDIRRFSGAFSFGPFLPVFSGYLRAVLPPGMLIGMTGVTLSPWLLLLFKKQLWKDPFLRTLWLLLFLLAIPFWDLTKLDMGFRLLLLATPLAAVLWVAALSTRPLPRKGTIAITLFFTPLLLLSMTVYDPARDPDYRLYSKVVEPIDLPPDALLISHQGMNFFYTYVKWNGPGWEGSLCYLPEYKMDAKKLWRMAHGVTFYEINRRYPRWVQDGSVKRLTWPYILIREDCWKIFLQDQPRERVRSLENWYNPHTVRPAYLRIHQKF